MHKKLKSILSLTTAICILSMSGCGQLTEEPWEALGEGEYSVITNFNGNNEAITTSPDSQNPNGTTTNGDSSDVTTTTGNGTVTSAPVETDEKSSSTTPDISSLFGSDTTNASDLPLVVTTTPGGTYTKPQTDTVVVTTSQNVVTATPVTTTKTPTVTTTTTTKKTTTTTKKPTTTTTIKKTTTTTKKPATTTTIKKTTTTTKKPTTTTTTTKKTTTTTKKTTTITTTKKTTTTSSQNGFNYDKQTYEYMCEVVRLVNIERAKEGLNPVTLDVNVTKGAMVRANEIITLFDHTRPDGSKCNTALDKFGLTFGGNYWAYGENIAAGYQSPAAVVEGWMNSPGHRANILRPYYNKIGVGYVTANDSYGKYWTQMFICDDASLIK